MTPRALSKIQPAQIGCFVVIAAGLLSACSIYRIDSDPNPRFDTLVEQTKAHLDCNELLKVEHVPGKYPEGLQCFEPLLFFLTLGVVPVHCVERYSASLSDPHVTENDTILREYRATTVAGWISFLLAPLPSWRFGDGRELADEIEAQIVNAADEYAAASAFHDRR